MIEYPQLKLAAKVMKSSMIINLTGRLFNINPNLPNLYSMQVVHFYFCTDCLLTTEIRVMAG